MGGGVGGDKNRLRNLNNYKHSMETYVIITMFFKARAITGKRLELNVRQSVMS